jgi:acyl carrier protein
MSKLTAETLRTRVAELISERFDIPIEMIRPEIALADLDLDSLALLELVDLLEEELGIEVAEENVRMEDTLGDVLALLEAKAGVR